MADIDFECPECKEYLSVDSKAAGRIVPCPKCGKKIQIPPEHANKGRHTAGNDELFVSLNGLSTDELIAIWVANNRKEHKDEAFDVIKSILISRNVPVTAPGQPVTYQQATPGPVLIETNRQPQRIEADVSIKDIDMPFWSMVTFMVKWAIASIPAMIILFLIAVLLVLLVGGCLTGIGAAVLPALAGR